MTTYEAQCEHCHGTTAVSTSPRPGYGSDSCGWCKRSSLVAWCKCHTPERRIRLMRFNRRYLWVHIIGGPIVEMVEGGLVR